MTHPQYSSDIALAQALYEAECYGIGATSDTNQRVILQAAKDLAAVAQQEAELFAWRWQKPFGDIGEWQVTKEKPTHAFRMLEPLYVGAAQAAPDALRAAAKRVCWFDWSDNDMDAVAAIDALRKALMVSSTSRGTEA